MKQLIPINYIFWKEGPLLPCLVAGTCICRSHPGGKPDNEESQF